MEWWNVRSNKYLIKGAAKYIINLVTVSWLWVSTLLYLFFRNSVCILLSYKLIYMIIVFLNVKSKMIDACCYF